MCHFLLHLLAARNVMNWNLMGTGDCNACLSNLMSAKFISMNFTVQFFFFWVEGVVVLKLIAEGGRETEVYTFNTGMEIG